jgi:uncharacterized protein YbjT (DUF2867 family)
MSETAFIPRTAVIAGATGLVGSHLLQLLLSNEQYERIFVLTRRELPITHPKLHIIIVQQHTELAEKWQGIQADVVFCCLGTTMKKAGSKEQFYQIDFTYPYELAKIALQNGSKAYFLVSALGADKGSIFYYNRVKGEIETAIRSCGFFSVHIFRPSLLLGKRRERRLGEDIGKMLDSLFSWLIPRKYRAIQAAKVAKAMMHYASRLEIGNYVHSSAAMQQF